MKCLSRKEQADRDNLLIKDYLLHKNPILISEKYSIHINTVFKILKRNGVHYVKRDHPAKIKESIRKEILDRYKEVKIAAFVAKEFNVNINVVLKIGKKFGIMPMKRGDLSRKYKCDFSFFNTINTEEKAYWLGFICADGNLYKNRLNIGIHKNDAHLLERFKKDIQAENPVKIYKTNSRGKEGWIATIIITSQEMVKDLINLGVEPRKTGNLKAEKILSFIPPFLIRHFYRGFIDGDGCFYSNSDGRPRFSIVEKGGHLIQKLRDFMVENGIKSLRFPKEQKNNCHHLSYGAIGDLEKIYHILYDDSTVFLKRKRDSLEKGLLLYSKSFKS